MAASASWAVLPTFSPISVATGRRLRIEVPRSPRTALADEAAVLHEDGLVQVELGAHLGDLIGIGHELGQHHLHGIAGDEEQHAEHGQRHPEQDRDHGEDAACRIQVSMTRAGRRRYLRSVASPSTG